MLNYLGGRFHRRKETWKSRDKILNTGTYTIIGYNWDLEQEEKNNDDEEETSLVLKRSMRNMGLLWSSWECYCMVGGEWEFKTRRWALLLIEFIREGDRHLKRETAKTCSNNCITWKEHCNTFGFKLTTYWKGKINTDVCVYTVSLTICDPWTLDHKTPLSMGFFRQEYWSGMPWPTPGDGSNAGMEPVSPHVHCRWILNHQHHTETPRYRGDSDGDESACNVWDLGVFPWSGRTPG